MALNKVKAVVVGAGAAGGIVAKELSEAGWSVVLLERGKWFSPFDNRKDDLRNERTGPLGTAFGPAAEDRYPRVLVDLNGRQRVILPHEPGYNNNAGCVGGGTFSYGAMAWRYLPQDFRMRSTYGAIEGANLEDWPIGYDDLEPFYEKAEWEVGVSGDWSKDPFHAPRRKALPMPPLPPNKEYAILEPAAKRLGLHPFDIPMLRNTVPYNGRGACMRCRWCVGFACEVDAKCGTHNTVIPKALATGNCELRTECIVKEILTEASGRVTGVSYFNPDGRLEEQPADVVIVSAAAIESARLLLNSKSAKHPKGLGNRYDLVGRNLQGHTYVGATGIFEQEVYDDVGPGAGLAICDFNHGNKGLAGGGLLANEFIRLPYQFVNMAPKGTPRWGKGHKDYMRQAYRRTIAIRGPVQEMPVYTSRVEVDPVVTDHWGIPVARMSGGRHAHTIEIGRFLASRADLWLKEAGAKQTWLSLPSPGLSAGQHQAGTCRMGNDPKISVVDKHCRVHDHDNLFVIDGSVHVTNGGFNPALTIMAVAYWASANLKRSL